MDEINGQVSEVVVHQLNGVLVRRSEVVRNEFSRLRHLYPHKRRSDLNQCFLHVNLHLSLRFTREILIIHIGQMDSHMIVIMKLHDTSPTMHPLQPTTHIPLVSRTSFMLCTHCPTEDILL